MGISVDIIPNGANIAVSGTNLWYAYGYKDILYVLQNNRNIISEISSAHKDVLSFIQEQLLLLISQRSSDEILSANIDLQILAESLYLLKTTIGLILKL